MTYVSNVLLMTAFYSKRETLYRRCVYMFTGFLFLQQSKEIMTNKNYCQKIKYDSIHKSKFHLMIKKTWNGISKKTHHECVGSNEIKSMDFKLMAGFKIEKRGLPITTFF
jgi:hypothetical protein